MAVSVNLPAYLERIGFSGSIAPTLDTLTAICRLHPTAIPFENLSPLLGLPVRLDQPSLEKKLLAERRGGYCFEHNLLLLHVLLDLGFVARGLLGTVLLDAPDDPSRPGDHMIVAVDIGGATYIADVGCGGFSPTSPLKLKADIEQSTPHEMFRLTGGPRYQLEMLTGTKWTVIYAFETTERQDAEFEEPNRRTSTPPGEFTRNLHVARAGKGRRHALTNAQYSIYATGSEPERRQLTSVAELKGVLIEVFGITLPAVENLDATLERILAEPAA